jgi:hypothetical protein
MVLGDTVLEDMVLGDIALGDMVVGEMVVGDMVLGDTVFPGDRTSRRRVGTLGRCETCSNSMGASRLEDSPTYLLPIIFPRQCERAGLITVCYPRNPRERHF